MNESKVDVFIDGRKCVVTYSNLESIVCNTTAASNATVASKVNIETYSVDAATVASEWLQVAETVSNVSSHLQFPDLPLLCIVCPFHDHAVIFFTIRSKK